MRHALELVGRSVYTLSLGAAALPDDDFEWYASYAEAGGQAGGQAGAVFPAGAPAVTQTVVWM